MAKRFDLSRSYPVDRKLHKGAQIAYVPTHVRQLDGKDWLDHPDTELGFVWEDEGDTVLCRYWSKHTLNTLRTRANSERCDKSDLVEHISCEVDLVNYWIKAIERIGYSDMPKF